MDRDDIKDDVVYPEWVTEATIDEINHFEEYRNKCHEIEAKFGTGEVSSEKMFMEYSKFLCFIFFRWTHRIS